MVRERTASSLVITRDLGNIGRARDRPRDRGLRWCRAQRDCLLAHREELAAADVVFYPSQVQVGDADVTKLGELDEVAGWAGFAINDSRFDEAPDEGTGFIAVGDGWFNTIERAKVLEGRLPDPAADDEAVIDVAATKIGVDVHVGSVFTWRSLSKEDSELYPEGAPEDFDWTTARGPVTKLRIVGIVRQPMGSYASIRDRWTVDHRAGMGRSAFGRNAPLLHQHARAFENGAGGCAEVQSRCVAALGRDDLPVKDLSVDVKRVQRSVELEETALILFGGAVVAAAIVLVGQGLLRSVRAGATALPVLRAMGLSRRSLYVGLLAPHLLTLAVMLAVATVTGAVLSARSRSDSRANSTPISASTSTRAVYRRARDRRRCARRGDGRNCDHHHPGRHGSQRCGATRW